MNVVPFPNPRFDLRLVPAPFADEAAAHAFARPKNSENWKALLREARAAKKARKAALEGLSRHEIAAGTVFGAGPRIALITTFREHR